VDLELDADQQELRDHARSFLADACPPSLVRDVFEGRATGDGLWAAMVDLGWPGLAADADHGGLGQGFIAEAVLASELGRAVAPGPWLATVTQFAPVLAEAGAGAAELFGQVAAGTTTGALALAEPGGHRPAEVRATARPTDAGWVLDGVKAHVPDGATAHHLAVVARLPGSAGETGVGAFLVQRGAASVEALTVVDPTLPLATVDLAGVEVDAAAVLLDPHDPGSFAALERVRRHATVALALSGVATARAIFEATVTYAGARHQFGRPIGSFQAIKHRLADLYLAVERADALAWYAACTIAEDDPRQAAAAAMAKAAAGDCQRLATRDGLQLHGGIGFTWEHDLHLWLKRSLTTAFLLGDAASHRAELARHLLGPAA
jgi:alkylation response protein AidB-like acyl-CoA dehydrogenase